MKSESTAATRAESRWRHFCPDELKRRCARAVYALVARRIPSLVPGATELRIWLAGFVIERAHPTAVIRQGVRLTRRLVLEERAGVGSGAQFLGPGLVTIGRDVIMGPECLFITADHPVPATGEGFRSQLPLTAPITVEPGVFLGARVTILPGVTVGRDAAVGAGAVGTKNVPTCATVVGNPARVVGWRRPSDDG